MKKGNEKEKYFKYLFSCRGGKTKSEEEFPSERNFFSKQNKTTANSSIENILPKGLSDYGQVLRQGIPESGARELNQVTSLRSLF